VIPLLTDDSLPLSRQIFTGLRRAIVNGTFRAGDRLPSTRLLADELAVSRTVVVIAYEQLLAEGYVSGRVGSGTFVSAHVVPASPGDGQPAELKLSAFGTAACEASTRLARPGGAGPRPRYDFAYGLGNTDMFPFEAWRRVAIAKLREAPLSELDYGPSAGSTSLRGAIAAHLRRARGVACNSSQVIIVNGSQQALDVAARVLLDRGEAVVIENPHYQGTRDIFAAAGAKLVPVPVDTQGIMTDALPRRARLAVVTPSHQFPTGAVLPLARRVALLDWARRANAAIVEDDYDGEFWYAGEPVEPLQTLDTDSRVIYVGTFSRTVYPSLRLGYLVAPPSLVASFVGAKWLCDRHTATLEQETLADFIESGAYERHLRRTRKALAERRRTLLTSLRSSLGDSVEITGENAGTHVVIWPRRRAVEEEVVRQAAGLGVGIYGTSRYFLERPGRVGFLLGYSRLTPRDIHDGVRRLREIPCFDPGAGRRAAAAEAR
jgi:GntR family transcriptional regulator/MocR family aminotransferase